MCSVFWAISSVQGRTFKQSILQNHPAAFFVCLFGWFGFWITQRCLLLVLCSRISSGRLGRPYGMHARQAPYPPNINLGYLFCFVSRQYLAVLRGYSQLSAKGWNWWCLGNMRCQEWAEPPTYKSCAQLTELSLQFSNVFLVRESEPHGSGIAVLWLNFKIR